MLSYPARLIPAGETGVELLLPDIPEVIVHGESEDEVFDRAVEELETALGGYVVDGRSIPTPSDICGAPTVTTEKYSLLGLVT